MIIVFGSINLDLIFTMPELPVPGQTLLARAARIEPGGKGANQAVAAARDGAQVVLAGAVGHDALADAALSGVLGAGIDVTRLARVEATTGCASIMTDAGGRNSIAVAAGANMLARADQVEDAILTPQSIVLLQMETDPDETIALTRRAKLRGAKTILNLAPALPMSKDALALLDLLIVNEDEAAFLGQAFGSGADAASLHKTLGVAVLRTLGAAGAEAVSNGEMFRIPGRAIDCLDSTAAGDGFTGVLAASLDRGLGLEAAMVRANAAAALACTRRGSQGSLPMQADIDAFIAAA
jgi:ribokinase